MDQGRSIHNPASNMSQEKAKQLDNLQPTLMTELPPLSTITSKLKCSWCRRFPSGGVWVCDDNHTICDRCMEAKNESRGFVAGCPMIYNVDGSFLPCTSPVTASTSLISQIFLQAKFMCPFYNCRKSFFLGDINKHVSQCDKRLASVSCFSEACSQTLAVSDYVDHLKSVHSAPVFNKSMNVFNIPFKREDLEVECVLGVYDIYDERFLLVKQETKSKYLLFCFVLNKDHANKFNVHFDVLIRGSSVKNCVAQVFPETNSMSDLILRAGFSTIRKDNVINATNVQGYWHLKINILKIDNSSVSQSTCPAAVALPPVAITLPMQAPIAVSTLPSPIPIPAKTVPPPLEPISVRAPRLNLPVPSSVDHIPPSRSRVAATSVNPSTCPTAVDLPPVAITLPMQAPIAVSTLPSPIPIPAKTVPPPLEPISVRAPRLNLPVPSSVDHIPPSRSRVAATSVNPSTCPTAVDLPPVAITLPMQAPITVSTLPSPIPIPAKTVPPPLEPIPVRAPRLNLPVPSSVDHIPPSRSRVAATVTFTSLGTGTGTKPPLAVSKPIPEVTSKEYPSDKDEVDKKSSGVMSKEPKQTRDYYTIPAQRVTIKTVKLPIPTKVTNKAYHVACTYSTADKAQHGEVKAQNTTGTNNQMVCQITDAQPQAPLEKASETKMKTREGEPGYVHKQNNALKPPPVSEERLIFSSPSSMTDADCLLRMSILRERIDKEEALFKSIEDRRMARLRSQPLLYKDVLDTYDKVKEIKRQSLERALAELPEFRKFHNLA